MGLDFMEQDLTGLRIATAMSGGVDSSLAAALLCARGAEVIGFTLQLYDHGAAKASSKTCCAGVDIHDAKQVAAKLNIPHYVLNYQRHFQEAVIDDFVDSYARGETPLPCTRCNERIKFSRLLDFAKDLGVDAFATGHYIRREGDALYCASDRERDQSYFLWTLTQAQLSFSLFPLGGLKKSETRARAAKFALPVADKPDSQDICFVPSGHYSDLVRRLRPDAGQSGEIVHMDGRVLGRHEGLYQFTVGQRRGLGIGDGGQPLYVVALDVPRQRLVVGGRTDCAVHALTLSNMNIISQPDVAKPLWVKLRSTQSPIAATLEGSRVVLAIPEPGVALGQACVFYQKCDKGMKVIGGGWISQTDCTTKRHLFTTDRGVKHITDRGVKHIMESIL